MTQPSRLHQKFRDDAPRSAELFERGRSSMAGVAKGAYFYAPYPLTMVRGEGCYLFDADGRRFVDFHNHHSSQILGHCHATVAKAVTERLEQGLALGAPVGNESELAEELCNRVESLDRVRFCNSGTEATLHAIRLARGFSGRPKIAKMEGGYHGSHDIVEVSVAPPVEKAGSATAPLSVPTAGGMSQNAPSEVIVLPYNDANAAAKLIRKHRDELACVMFDPRAGIYSVQKEFAQALRQITRENDVLLVFDEIVGFRFGYHGLQAHYEIDPDLTTFGKLVGGGFPIGALGGRADVMDLFDPTRGPTGFFQSGTFSAHPVAMAAGLATLQELTPAAFSHLNRLGDRVSSGLNGVFEEKDFTARALNLGSVFSIHFTRELVDNYRKDAAYDKSLRNPLFLALIEQGHYISPSLGMSALSTPMEDAHINGLVDAMGRAIDRVRETSS